MARELSIIVSARNLAAPVLKSVKSDIRGLQSEAVRGVQQTGRNLALIGAASAGVIAVNVKAGIESLAELERQNAQTAAALESTGSTSGGDLAAIRARADALEDLTAVDDKVIQNAQNLLLTFRDIREDAFEPTLKAALDMNAAMGGDDESLQQVLIQVGKAVNDPLTGLTALRRVGVSFTEQQKQQIKTMQEAGDVAGAQAIVLAELNAEFGGSAAAQADTYAGKMKGIQDAVEGAQMALATAFLPALERAGDKLETFLEDPENLQNIENFGGIIADGLEDAIGIVERIPWDAVGSTFGIMGTGAKVVLDTFTSLPDWVQTAVLTGWGFNKLTGGAAGNLAKTLIQKLGLMNIHAGVVNVSGPVAGGGGGTPTPVNTGSKTPRAPSKGFSVGDLLTNFATKGTLPTFLISMAGSGPVSPEIQAQMEDFRNEQRATTDGVSSAEAAIVRELELSRASLPNLEEEFQGAMEAKIARLETQLAGLRGDVTTGSQRTTGEITRQAAAAASSDRAMLSSAATQAARLQSLTGYAADQSGKLGGILAKKTSVTAVVNTTVNVSLQEWQRKQISSIRAESGSGGFI